MLSQKIMSLLLASLFLCSYCWAGAQPARQVSTAKNPSFDLLMAILKDDAALVRSAVVAGADINQEIGGIKPIVLAMCKDKAFEALLELGADYNIMLKGEKLVHRAIKIGSRSAYLLIKKGADFSGWPDQDLEIMYFVGTQCNLELATELLNKGYNPNKIKNRPLQCIIARPEMLEVFLKHGLNPNLIARNDAGSTLYPWTPLTIAASSGQVGSIKLLIAAGADVNQAAPQTPIFYAIAAPWGNTEMIELLMAHGAKL